MGRESKLGSSGLYSSLLGTKGNTERTDTQTQLQKDSDGELPGVQKLGLFICLLHNAGLGARFIEYN